MAAPMHLAKRFFGAIKPGPPPLTDERWALRQLLPGEAEIWRRMNNPDRRHAIEVARAVDAQRHRWSESADVREVCAAALLHDCGKVVSGLRTPARVLATVFWLVVDEDTADRWLSDGSGIRLRLAQYRRHPSIGAGLLQAAGSARLTPRWAEQHPLPPHAWSVPAAVGSVLKDCDDD